MTKRPFSPNDSLLPSPLRVWGWRVGLVLTVLGLGWILVETFRLGNTGFQEQTLWDWMGLLIVPLLIPISVLWLTRRTQENERRLATYRAQRQQLQAYYDRITELIVEHKLGHEGAETAVCSIARTLTLSATPDLDERQKGQIILFLYDTRLIIQPAVLELRKADLQRAQLEEKADLRRIYLREADLTRASFERANLFLADFRDAQLQNANLVGTVLMQANLRGAYLVGAQLREAVLKDTDFRGADLRAAVLDEADLTDADFRRTDLTNASFQDAVLINSNFSDAQLLPVQLETAKVLTNVTLPDGEKLTR